MHASLEMVSTSHCRSRAYLELWDIRLLVIVYHRHHPRLLVLLLLEGAIPVRRCPRHIISSVVTQLFKATRTIRGHASSVWGVNGSDAAIVTS